jgi:ubiquitin-like modifier-activating enzyme 5
VAKYLGYNALLDFFPTMVLKPNEICSDSFCVKRQHDYQLLKQNFPEKIDELKSDIKEEDLHPENEFGNFSAYN